jgi:hypothetical protein
MRLLVLLLLLVAGVAGAAEPPPPPPPGSDVTPPRLSFIDGAVSFWRPGADDWTPARVNTPLAAGDELYTGERANLEVQIGPRAFVRAAQKTQLGLVNLEPDFLQFRVAGGHASLDLRSVPAGHTVELDTPNAVFTIEHPGYYRVIVGDGTTHFITRRGGRATLTVAGGAPHAISPSEQIIVRSAAAPAVETYVAPELDAWDRWNYARTDHEIEALSARYVSPGVYGVGTLDVWGAWRIVPTYGAVWVPDRLAPGWAPYTLGSWIWDPFYGWTWVDDAPWGWAPFHYGRWVFVDGFWAWAPGPVIVRPVYAPALVAFFGVAPSASVRIGLSGPGVGWVALGWGEPLRPWWGPPGFVGAPWWGGWGGPRLAAGVHQHTRSPLALAVVSAVQFGAGPVRAKRFSAAHQELERIGEPPAVRPRAGSLAPARGQAVRPPPQLASRPVLATRAPREAPLPFKREAPAKPLASAPTGPRIVVPPKRPDASIAPARPAFADKGPVRPRPAQPPRLEDMRRAPPPASSQRPLAREAREPRALPGKPANVQQQPDQPSRRASKASK